MLQDTTLEKKYTSKYTLEMSEASAVKQQLHRLSIFRKHNSF